MVECSKKGPGTDVFTLCSSVENNANNIYCCSGIENRFMNYDDPYLFVAAPSCVNFNFYYKNDDGVPTLKSALNATAQSPWVRIAFQEYCADGTEAVNATNNSIITTGNISQTGGGSNQTCTASIKAFQYGWGTVDSGNRCRITIIDEEGGSFETWARRMATNAEASSTPIKGSYNMKVQWGWYITGGGPNDQCGQGAAQPPIGENTSDPAPGQNTSYNICSPTLWFLPDAITVNWENGKFIYTLEGVDLLVRGQEQRISKVAGQDGGTNNPFNKKMYFTEAVRLLGKWSKPPFRVRFLARNVNGDIVPMRFLKRDGNADDDECKGPFAQWTTGEKAPLDIINNWKNNYAVKTLDQTDSIASDDKAMGITVNYDPSFQLLDPNPPFPIDPDQGCEALAQGTDIGCVDRLPDKGCLLLWSSNGVPHCQNNVTNLDARMKAVYIVNGGNCSPVIAFNPVVRWHFLLGLKSGGVSLPLSGYQRKQTEGLAATGCAVAGGSGPTTQPIVAAPATGTMNNPDLQAASARVLHTAGNLMVHAIEAELRVQGDPSPWLCSPIFGFGKCVGIIFINPFYLRGGDDGTCPQFEQTTNNLCNNFLTNKGWFIKGVDHQIKEGSYITTIKVALPAPGAELKFGVGGNVTGLGGWSGGAKLQFGGLNANINEFPVGNAAGEWIIQPTGSPESGCAVCFQGGGSACDDGVICDNLIDQMCNNGEFCDGTLFPVPCP